MWIVRVSVGGLALLAAALLVPGLEIDWGEDRVRALLILITLAILFTLVRSVLTPHDRVVTLPLKVLTVGLFPVLLDAALLLLVAGVADAVSGPLIVVGGFPPDLGAEALVTAVIGSVIIAAVTTLMGLLIPSF